MHLSYVIVGSGYRARFYARIARTYPSLFSAMFLCRSEEKAALMTRETGVPAVWSAEEAMAFHPEFVVVVVNKASIADVCAEWVNRGYPVLMETPAGMTREQLLRLWDLSQNGARIAVAEQYHRYPDIIAGLQAIADGKIGTPGTAYLSVAHDYHGMSLIRRMLRTEGESYTIRGSGRCIRLRRQIPEQAPSRGIPSGKGREMWSGCVLTQGKTRCMTFPECSTTHLSGRGISWSAETGESGATRCCTGSTTADGRCGSSWRRSSRSGTRSW